MQPFKGKVILSRDDMSDFVIFGLNLGWLVQETFFF